MRIVLFGKSANRICDWKSYASLRDVVLRVIEHGQPGEHFQALHGIEAAFQGEAHYVDALRLRGEVLRAWTALWKAHHDGVDFGTMSDPISTDEAQPISRAAHRFILSVLVLANFAREGELLEVRRVEEEPRVVGRGPIGSTEAGGRLPRNARHELRS